MWFFRHRKIVLPFPTCDRNVFGLKDDVRLDAIVVTDLDLIVDEKADTAQTAHRLPFR